MRLSLPFGIALAASAALLAGAVAPGWLGADAGAFVREAYSVLCHQLPHRSPHLGGAPWALCHRCTGIAAGLALGLLAVPALTPALRTRVAGLRAGRLIALSLLPIALDWSLGALGVWANTPLSRVATGAVFGVAAGVVLGVALLRPRLAPDLSPNLLSP